MTKAEKFNARMDDIFYATPGCWHGSMPRIETSGELRQAGHICMDPERAAHGIHWLSRHFSLTGPLLIGDIEQNGKRTLTVSFYLTAKEESKARQAARTAPLYREPVRTGEIADATA